MSDNEGAKDEITANNFIRDRITEDIAAGKNDGRVQTRFPPEPNGYLHIGHAKAIWLGFGMASEFGGLCNLRMDDTNPSKEEVEYVEAIQNDVRWLGYDWDDRLFYASDYFDVLYGYAVQLIKDGKAYVDDLSAEEISEYRGNFYKPGRDSPHRTRSIEENLALFERMKNGEFEDGACVLRAKIDMQSPNLNMRDPTLYRIQHRAHHRTGDKWCIYPMYDFAHALSDAQEGITHSLCTLEFEAHRPLYDWCLENLPVPSRPEQIEFARLNLSYTVLSKRKALELVNGGHVDGWDDPRMPTLRGMRRRGYTGQAIINLCERVGVSKRDGVVDVSLLEHALREDLNRTSPRVLGVLDPIKLVITNYPEDKEETFSAALHPEDESYGRRDLPFCRELWVERDDFREVPPKKWRRLTVGKEVRLRYACYVTCTEVIKDDSGKVVELRCEWDPESRGGRTADGRKVRGTIHWVSARHAIEAEVRLYERLFSVENPNDVPEGGSFLDFLNPNSLEVVKAWVEPGLAGAAHEARYQLERLGYFCVDTDSTPDQLVLNRTIALKDSWAKFEKKLQKA